MSDTQHRQYKQSAKGTVESPRQTERRRSPRGGQSGEPSRAHLVRLVLGTYREMPGLTLHLHQAARLFGLREPTCLAVLSDLVRGGQLRQSPDGQYLAGNLAAVF